MISLVFTRVKVYRTKKIMTNPGKKSNFFLSLEKKTRRLRRASKIILHLFSLCVWAAFSAWFEYFIQKIHQRKVKTLSGADNSEKLNCQRATTPTNTQCDVATHGLKVSSSLIFPISLF